VRDVALVGDDQESGAVGSTLRSWSSTAMSICRSSSFGLASVQVIGRSAGVQTRCRRRPQKNREWQEPQPPGLGTDPEQCLGHRESHQLGIGQPRRSSSPGGLAQMIVDLDVECGQRVFRSVVTNGS
jgi:hypothetical protein